MTQPMTGACSHRAIWRIAAPMMLSSITVPLLGAVDTAVMGHLEDARYLGAVAAGATIFSVLFMGVNFLRMGTTGITAQALGAGDRAALREALGQGMITAGLLAALFLLLQAPLGDLALWLLDPSSGVAGYTRDYFAVRIWSAPATLANFVIIGWLLGMQNARGPLAMTLVINLTNIVLDLVLVVGLGMTVRGVALATLASELAGLGLGLYLVRSLLARHPGDWHRERLLQFDRYRRIVSVNANLFLRTLALMFTFAFITAQGARMGDVILAANALLLNFQYFLAYALDGIAHAAEALVGRALGAGNRTDLLLAVRRTLRWSIAFAAAFCIVYWIAGEYIIGLLTSIEAVRARASEFLPWVVALPLVSVWCFLYDGVFVGATRSREMRVVMAAATVLVFLPAWALARPWGNHALWLAFSLFMAARGIGMHLWFRRLVRTGKIGDQATAPKPAGTT